MHSTIKKPTTVRASRSKHLVKETLEETESDDGSNVEVSPQAAARKCVHGHALTAQSNVVCRSAKARKAAKARRASEKE